MIKPKSWFEIWLRKDASWCATPKVQDFVLGASCPQVEFLNREVDAFLHHVSNEALSRPLCSGDVVQACAHTKDGTGTVCLSYLVARVDQTHLVPGRAAETLVGPLFPDFALVKLGKALAHTFTRRGARQ